MYDPFMEFLLISSWCVPGAKNNSQLPYCLREDSSSPEEPRYSSEDTSRSSLSSCPVISLEILFFLDLRLITITITTAAATKIKKMNTSGRTELVVPLPSVVGEPKPRNPWLGAASACCGGL